MTGMRVVTGVRVVRARIDTSMRFMPVRCVRAVDLVRAVFGMRSVAIGGRISALVVGVHLRYSFVRSSRDCNSDRPSARGCERLLPAPDAR
ncbi:MAG TPA: hypothetical protein VFH11_07880 [Gemmatimonadota bacterium]|nr:hypothetical protein [Gemmatimonadota bacterium]